VLTRRTALGALLSPFFLAACGLGRGESYRYRLTVNVKTPEGLSSGSSVIEVRHKKGPGFPGPEASQLSTETSGEAVAVDLGTRGTLFAVLNSPFQHLDAAEIAQSLTVPQANVTNTTAENNRVPLLRRGVIELPRERYPLLIHFLDMDDPSTVEEVSPDDLQSTFGPGVQLVSITIQATTDPVTYGIKHRFAWWSQYIDRHFDNSSTISESLQDSDLKGHLSSGSFSTKP
jgi:hypothetical protein